MPSRRQICGRGNRVPRGLHLVCGLGACGYYSRIVDDEHRQLRVDEGLVDLLAQLQII
jgi:hypothetical protein